MFLNSLFFKTLQDLDYFSYDRYLSENLTLCVGYLEKGPFFAY